VIAVFSTANQARLAELGLVFRSGAIIKDSTNRDAVILPRLGLATLSGVVMMELG